MADQLEMEGMATAVDADRDRYVRLSRNLQTRVRVALRDELHRNAAQRKQLHNAIAGAVAALERQPSARIMRWLRPRDLEALAATEFEELVQLPCVAGLSYAADPADLVVDLTPPAPRRVRLKLDGAHARLRVDDAPSDWSTPTRLAVEAAGTALLAAGDLPRVVAVVRGGVTAPDLDQGEADEADADAADNPAPIADGEPRAAYISHRTRHMLESITRDTDLEGLERRLSEADGRLSRLLIRVREIQEALRLETDHGRRTTDALRQEYDMLCEIPGVKAVGVSQGNITVRTEPIHIAHGGSTYTLGRYEITLEAGRGIRFHNLDHRVKVLFGMADHPHVIDGRPCWGNAEGFFATRIAQHDHPAVILQALEFLGSYYSGSTFAKIHMWPKKEP